MSLLVWLPMTKDLTQQGLSDITVSNVGATLDNNGKLEKCYYFDGNAHYLEFSKSVGDLYSGDFSYAVWLKPMDDTRSVICSEYASSGASNIAFELSASRQVRLYWNGSPDISSTGCILPKSQWTHIAITRSGNEAKFYMNGELKYTYTGTLANKTSTAKIRLGDDYRGGTSVSYMGYMNDFRIYDHALSAKEVEVLSRGLVCHYPLNNNGGGQPNLYNFESVASTWKVTEDAELTLVDATDDVYGNVLKITTPSSVSSVRIYRGVENVWKADTNFTVSFLAKASKTTVLKIERSRTDFAPDVTVGTTWERYSTVIPCSATTTGGALGIQTSTASADIYLTQIKVELGDKATAYCPGVGDSHYIPLGYDSTTEYDVSGYQNNGTKNGTLTYSSDTARYSVSTVLDGDSASIQIPNLYEMLGSNGSASYSVSVWTYKSRIGTKAYQTILGGGSGFEIEARNASGNDPEYVLWSWGKISAPYEFNRWNHMVFTKQDSEVKLYVNGVLANQGTSSTAVVNSTYFIGAWNTATQQNYDGQMSDLRIYATALSAEQVAELYNTAVSVTNNGTLMGYELVEV